MELVGRVALVTGAASGIGRATASRLATAGMRVCVVDRDGDGARRTAAEVDGTFVVADASQAEEIDAAFDHCRRQLGSVDLAFLNAGIAIGRSDIGVLEADEYRRILGINVDGVVFGTRAAIRAMREQAHGAPPDGRGGVIIATASLAGIVPFPPDPVYALTKHAVVGFIRSLAPTLVADGIAAHAICPGMTDTHIVGNETKAMLRDAGFPLMEPAQIADAVVLAATADDSGSCWICQPGRPTIRYEFRDVPGPRVEGAEGRVPPGMRDGQTGVFQVGRGPYPGRP